MTHAIYSFFCSVYIYIYIYIIINKSLSSESSYLFVSCEINVWSFSERNQVTSLIKETTKLN